MSGFGSNRLGCRWPAGNWLALLWLLFGLAGLPSLATAAEAPVIVVNPAVPAESLNDASLRLIFAMRLRNWPDGSPIRVFVLPDDHPLHERFAKRRLRGYPHQLRRMWDDLVFSGTGQAPTVVPDLPSMRAAVAGTSGAIGYLPASEVQGDVRIVPTE